MTVPLVYCLCGQVDNSSMVLCLCGQEADSSIGIISV